jgi:hypothetical protein
MTIDNNLKQQPIVELQDDKRANMELKDGEEGISKKIERPQKSFFLIMPDIGEHIGET